MAPIFRIPQLLAEIAPKQALQRAADRQMFISKIESGTRQVHFIEVEQFAQIYGKRLSFFSTLRRIPRGSDLRRELTMGRLFGGAIRSLEAGWGKYVGRAGSRSQGKYRDFPP